MGNSGGIFVIKESRRPGRDASGGGRETAKVVVDEAGSSEGETDGGEASAREWRRAGISLQRDVRVYPPNGPTVQVG